jgi:glycosyltransferase involved in cell wall biosynthesis
VDEADKPVLYNLAAMFIYPSYYEGFGLPVLEAMACGCPVIAAADSSLFEVIGAAGLLVNPYSRGEIITAILSLRNDSDFRTEMVTRGRQRAEQFSWRLTATKTLEVLENCFNQKR